MMPMMRRRTPIRRLEILEPCFHALPRLLLHSEHRRVDLSIRGAEVGAVEAVGDADGL